MLIKTSISLKTTNWSLWTREGLCDCWCIKRVHYALTARHWVRLEYPFTSSKKEATRPTPSGSHCLVMKITSTMVQWVWMTLKSQECRPNFSYSDNKNRFRKECLRLCSLKCRSSLCNTTKLHNLQRRNKTAFESQSTLSFLPCSLCNWVKWGKCNVLSLKTLSLCVSIRKT